MLEVSHSSCSMARSCPMKYKWRYVDGYKPIRKSTALALGTIIHSAFDMYYNRFSFDEVTNYIITTMDEQIANAGLPEQEDLKVIKYTALGMWVNAPNKNLLEFQEIKSEKEFRVRIGKMKGVIFRGKSDRLVKKDGKWWVGELKTTGLPFQNFKNRMTVSDQVTAYVYAWRKKGYPVQGVIFDFIKKPLLRKGMKENCMEFSFRIANDYKDRPKDYFQRHFEYRSDVQLRRWEQDIGRTIQLIRRIWKGDCYRNPDSCWNYNAECPYKKICFAEKLDPLTVELYYEKSKGRSLTEAQQEQGSTQASHGDRKP